MKLNNSLGPGLRGIQSEKLHMGMYFNLGSMDFLGLYVNLCVCVHFSLEKECIVCIKFSKGYVIQKRSSHCIYFLKEGG